MFMREQTRRGPDKADNGGQAISLATARIFAVL